jgi:glutathione S-transferase
MLTVWGRRSSFNLQKVMWLVAELGIEHRHIEPGGQFGGLDTPEFRAINPRGRVPVIDESGAVVWESHAILRYLAARYGRGSFWSDDEETRSFSDRWMDWAQTTLQPDFLVGVFWAFYRTLNRKETGSRSRSGSTDAHITSGFWIDYLQIERSCWVTSLLSPTSPSGPVSIAISI